jgi:hypothetical protein
MASTSSRSSSVTVSHPALVRWLACLHCLQLLTRQAPHAGHAPTVSTMQQVSELTGRDLNTAFRLRLWRNPYTDACVLTGMGWTDGRTVNGMYMYLAALRWVQQAFPFWNATGGADHLVMATHDEASCWVPNEWRNATLLTHWAPLNHPRDSRSAWLSDRYSHKYDPGCSRTSRSMRCPSTAANVSISLTVYSLQTM